MMKNSKHIIKELEKLVSHTKIEIGGFFDPIEGYSYEPIKDYIKAVAFQTKPETASHDLFKTLIKDVLDYDNLNAFSEVNIGFGFVDFMLKESAGNPILIELKPLFKVGKNKTFLKADSLDYTAHKDQILKYLSSKKNEYIILTNLKDAFLFSRNAIIEFAPFKHLTFAELLTKFFEYENLWDTVRRIEDDDVKIDLDKSFFTDLKNWYKEFQCIRFVENEKFSKEELIVLLLNKVIFIKTLEDFGLVQFKHLVDEYYDKKDKWGAKGSEKILSFFFHNLEEYFDYFYDTELFKTRIWDYVVKDKQNTNAFLDVFEKTLGLDAWNSTFGRGMIHYNYRWIDEDIFGKAYETFIAENKKDSGIYYTSKDITQYMAKKIVTFLFEQIVDDIIKYVHKDIADYEAANKLLETLYQIKIIDPSSGSGSFLIKVLREVYAYYQKIDQATAWVESFDHENLFDMPETYTKTIEFRKQHNFSNHLQLISKIILRHIYAADIDERALDTAKTNIWKEAIKLRPKIYNYKKLNGASSHILPNLELNFCTGDSLADLPIEQQLSILESEHKQDIKRMFVIRNKYEQNPFFPEDIDEAVQIKQKLYDRLKCELSQIEKPVFLCVSFFTAYFDEEGNPLPQDRQGFNGVISNPPWEAIKPIEKEFAGKGKGSSDILDFKKWFNKKLEADQTFKKEWEEYKNGYELYNAYISERYYYQGNGDPNFYKYFLERDLEILKKDGMLNILIPSGIQTDQGSSGLRKLLTTEYLLQEISSFENKGYEKIIDGKAIRIKLFPEVHPQFKFSIVNVVKTPSHPFSTFDAKFYLHHPKELYEKAPIEYTVDLIKKFSPENLSIMEFRSGDDYTLCAKLRSGNKLFGELPYKLNSEFHMTNDSSLFHNKKEIVELSEKEREKFLCLYEGKMIHQFSSSFDEPRYYILESEAKASLLATERNRVKRLFGLKQSAVNKLKINLDYQDYRLVYRAIGSSTNERSIIASLVPKKVFLGHSLNYLANYLWEDEMVKQVETPKEDALLLLSLFNSLTLNYYIRNKISANLTMNFMNELPIPEATQEQKEYIVKTGLTILYLSSKDEDYDKLLRQLKTKIDKKADIIKLRAELEFFIAKELFNLTKEEWDYLTATFVYGAKSETKKELDQIISYSKELFTDKIEDR